MAGVNLDRDLETQDEIDLLKLTRNHFPGGDTFEVVSAHSRFPIVNRVFQKERAVMTSGTMYEDTVFIDDDGTTQAERVRPMQVITGAVYDSVARYHIPLRKVMTRWVMDHDSISRNRAPSRLKSIDVPRKLKAQLDQVKILEVDGFGTPATATDDLRARGLKYWTTAITQAQATADTWGHQGSRPIFQDGNPDTTGAGGIDPEDARYALWKNWNGRYPHDDIIADFDDDDVDRILELLLDMEYEVPMHVDDWKPGRFADKVFYINRYLLRTMDRQARLNNDSLLADLGKYAGSVVVKGVPLVYAPKLDSGWLDTDSANSYPLLYVNHNYFKPLMMEGDVFRQQGPMPPDQTQPDVFMTFIWLTYNYLCTNRRLAVALLSREPQA